MKEFFDFLGCKMTKIQLGWKGEGVVELGLKFVSKMSFIQCWLGILVYISAK
jgi:hypothetical protein